MQEIRGSSAGDAIYMLTRTLRGGLEHRGTATDMLNSVGLTPEQSKIHRNKAGKITGYGGSVQDSALLASNPDEWVWKVFKPALKKLDTKRSNNRLNSPTAPCRARPPT